MGNFLAQYSGVVVILTNHPVGEISCYSMISVVPPVVSFTWKLEIIPPSEYLFVISDVVSD